MTNLKTKLQMIITAILVVFGLTLFATATALADSASTIQNGVDSASGQSGSTDTTDPINHTITTVINLLSVGIGVIAVIMLMVGGLRYITSGGNTEATGKAKKTILYALIGLAIVALSQIIAQFVLQKTNAVTASSMIQETTVDRSISTYIL